MKSPSSINNWGLREGYSRGEPKYFQRQRNTAQLQILPCFQRQTITSNGPRPGPRIHSFLAEKPRKVEEYFTKNIPNIKHEIKKKVAVTSNESRSIRTTIACTNFVRIESPKATNYNFSPKDYSGRQNSTYDHGYIQDVNTNSKRLFSPQDLGNNYNFATLAGTGRKLKKVVNKKYSKRFYSPLETVSPRELLNQNQTLVLNRMIFNPKYAGSTRAQGLQINPGTVECLSSPEIMN